MGGCVTTHQKPSAVKVQQVLLGSNDIKPPIIKGDLAAAAAAKSAPSFRDFGSKEETFFDSQAWLDSDCDDDFMSVNGEFTPSRGNTPVHHNFSAGNNKPTVSPYQPPSPNGSEKKMRLSDLFNDSQRSTYDAEFKEDAEPANKNGVNSNVQSPLVHGGEVAANGGNGLKTKRERFRSCFPSLLSSRSSSTNARKMMSPGLSPSPNPNPVVG